MKKLLLFILPLLPIISHAENLPLGSPFANTYYISSAGANSNPGTQLQPWKTLGAIKNLPSGSQVFVSGGNYNSWPAGSVSTYMAIENCTNLTVTSLIGLPIFDFTSVGVPLANDPVGLAIIGCPNIHFSKIRITGLAQNRGGSGISRGFELYNSPNSLIEQVTVDHIGGSGFKIYDNCNGSTFYRCDAYWLDDRYSNPSPWGGADGFSCTGNVNTTNLTFTECRMWWCSDDGTDNFNTDGTRIYNRCWSFRNGYEPGTYTLRANGDGYKLGPLHTSNTGTITKFLNECLAFDNGTTGYDQNGVPTTLYQVYNCDAFRNKGDGFNFQFWESGTTNPLAHTFRNNISYVNTGIPFKFTGPTTNISNNTWQPPPVVANGSFAGLDTTGCTGPRGPNGELPVLNLLYLSPTSNLIAAGTNVGYGTDIGAYQYSGTTPVTANAGSGVVLTLPTNTTTLNGSGTGTSISYQWTALVAPGAFTFSSSTSAVTDVSNLVQGTYTFRLRVASPTDTAYSTVQIIVNPSGGSIVPTGVIIRSVTVNRFGTTTLQYDATVTANSRSFNIQRRSPRGTVYSSIGTQSATAGKLAYKLTFQSPAGYIIRVCPVDKQGSPVCSAGVVVKKN